MANDTSVGVNVYGYDRSASSTLKKIGQEAENTGGIFKKIGTIAAGVFSAQTLQSGLSAVSNFAKESINAYQSVGKEVINLQRYTGGTAEEMSKLRFAAEESGVGADTLATALGKMAKAAATTAGEKKFAALGIDVKTANGSFKSASSIFTEVAGKIAAMPPGIAKTNAIMQIFGKSGMQLYPLLNQGAAGIQKFAAEAQKMGLVLNGDSLKGVQENVMAQREFHASVEGLQVQLGQYLYPALTAVTKGFSEIIPVLTNALRPAFEVIGKVMSFLVPIIQQVAGYVVDLIGKFSGGSGSAGAFSGAGKVLSQIMSDLKQIFEALLPVLKTIFEFIEKYAVPVMKVSFKLALDVVVIAVAALKDAILFVIAVFKDLFAVGKAVGTGLKDIFVGIITVIKDVINGVITVINLGIAAVNAIPHVHIPGTDITLGLPKIPEIPKLAKGGIVTSPTIAMIGEAGAEAVVPLSKMGSMGGGMTVTINVRGSVIAESDLVAQVRDQMAQLLRRKGAPTAALGL